MRAALKRKASSVFAVAIKQGVIVRPDGCSECGSSKNIQGHHEDYTKPLDVVWLCCKCHKKRHQLSIEQRESLRERAIRWHIENRAKHEQSMRFGAKLIEARRERAAGGEP